MANVGDSLRRLSPLHRIYNSVVITLSCCPHFLGHGDVQRQCVHVVLLPVQLKLPSLKVESQIRRLSRVLLYVLAKSIPFLSVRHDVNHAEVPTFDADDDNADNQQQSNRSHHSHRDNVPMGTGTCSRTYKVNATQLSSTENYERRCLAPLSLHH